jgi:hypothetical protein
MHFVSENAYTLTHNEAKESQGGRGKLNIL